MWTARAQDAHDGLRGRHAGLRRRHEVDIGFLRAGGWIEGLSLLSYMRGSSAAIRLVHLCMNANRMLAIVYAHTTYERLRALSRQLRQLLRLSARAHAYAVCTPLCLTLSSP